MADTLTAPCAKCGKEPDGAKFLDGVLRPGHCFDCTFWLNALDEVDSGTRPRTYLLCDGRFYYAGTRTEKTPARERGMGGASHCFQFEDNGGLLFTVDLWHRGELPERFIDRAPRKAKRLSRAEFDALMRMESEAAQ